MNKNILVTTDFSRSSINALNYACEFAKDYNLKILIACIYSIPNNYAGDGLSLASINDALGSNAQMLKDELARVKNNFPEISITAEIITGDFVESLQELKQDIDPALIIIGALREYSELWLWGNEWLNALIVLSCPVLVIPEHTAYTPIMRIAIASDNKRVELTEQINSIKKLVNLSNANFYIVHVTTEPNLKEENMRDVYDEVFSEIDPQYYTVENKSVIKGLAEFIQQYLIDILIVIPRKHGLWYNLLNKSYTKQLALLNNQPVMAIHENS